MSKKGSYGDNGLTPDVEAKLKGFVLDELKTYVMTALLLKDDEVARTV